MSPSRLSQVAGQRWEDDQGHVEGDRSLPTNSPSPAPAALQHSNPTYAGATATLAAITVPERKLSVSTALQHGGAELRLRTGTPRAKQSDAKEADGAAAPEVQVGGAGAAARRSVGPGAAAYALGWAGLLAGRCTHGLWL